MFFAGTNNLKKELFTLAFLDSNNRAFNGGRAFIPNGQQWVYHLIFRYCLPTFWGDTICRRLKLMMTDGCSQEYMAFIDNSGKKNSFPKAVNGLCYFHTAVMGYNKHVKPCLQTKSKFLQCIKVFVLLFISITFCPSFLNIKFLTYAYTDVQKLMKIPEQRKLKLRYKL